MARSDDGSRPCVQFVGFGMEELGFEEGITSCSIGHWSLVNT